MEDIEKLQDRIQELEEQNKQLTDAICTLIFNMRPINYQIPAPQILWDSFRKIYDDTPPCCNQ